MSQMIMQTQILSRGPATQKGSGSCCYYQNIGPLFPTVPGGPGSEGRGCKAVSLQQWEKASRSLKGAPFVQKVGTCPPGPTPASAPEDSEG